MENLNLHLDRTQERARFQIKMLLVDLEAPFPELNDWEEHFVYDIAKRLEEHPDLILTAKQLDKIDQIYRKE